MTSTWRSHLRRLYMRSTSLSVPWAGSRAYVRALYAGWARIYDWSIGWDPAFVANAKRLTDTVVRQGDCVLDVGIGTGLLAELAAARARKYVGIDYSDAMLARAGRKVAKLGLDTVELCRGDARALPFEDEAFDVVISSFVLPHFSGEEKRDVLREMTRTLGPGGRLGLFLAQGEVAPLFCKRRELRALLEAAGLTEIRIEDRDDVYRIATARKP